ncbi:SHOCT domain-containing protein [Streptomyces meridianus]|uniref:SHOCT domain-containing protein n=1 Tax=Streptomyces meridianus TaxID=2938945 RepID=A0ABT0X1H4_9ACTN|nr:SHOCT domain-containing protein [Streptomyces meridianus]MCM2576005.1 SHOCT domain-containing protein [Streptomyces meridianus]
MNNHVNLAWDFPLLSAFLVTVWIFLWVIWLVLLIRVIGDIFRDHDLSGGAKVGWLLFVIVLPFLGVFVYLTKRGTEMAKREELRSRRSQEEADAQVRAAAGTGGTSGADELTKLSDLKARGEITDSEFQQAKEKILH